MTTIDTHRNRIETCAMRNKAAACNDQTLVPRGRKPRGGHIWINLLGRAWVVKRREATWLGIIGTALGALGVVGLAWGSADRFQPDRLGIVLVVVGAILICYKRLETKNLAADEIYKVAYDRGREDGYDEGYEDRGMEQPVRPVVVPMATQRCGNCGSSPALQSVGSVADRG